jgi:biotin-dependent carboxylase-like uncharacterized protein
VNDVALRVIAAGPLTTVQDLGRGGHAALGVGPSGAADRPSHVAAQRAVGNAPDAAGLELTFGGLCVEAIGDAVIALAGAPCSDRDLGRPFPLQSGEQLSLRTPRTGLRSYLAVRGGIAVAPTLGSRSTDLLSGLGPPPLRDGDVLPVGRAVTGEPQTVDAPGVDVSAPLTVRVRQPPWPERVDPASWDRLCEATFTVSTDSNRVAVRLSGPGLDVAASAVEPEPLVAGAIQLPGDGLPIVVLVDHPVTGGYPVAGVVADDDLRLLAQARPGTTLRFAPAEPR